MLWDEEDFLDMKTFLRSASFPAKVYPDVEAHWDDFTLRILEFIDGRTFQRLNTSAD